MTVTVLGGALSLLTASCSGDDAKNADDTPRSTTPETTTTTLTPQEVAEQEVITAREAADDAQIEALAPPAPNPDLPALAETHTGLMLERMKETADGLRIGGIASRLPNDTQHRLVVESVKFDEVDGLEVAFLEVCLVEDAERINLASGGAVAEGLKTFRSSEAMQKVDGVWKLAERRQDSFEEGVAACSAD